MADILTEEQCEALRWAHDHRPDQLLPRDVDRLLATVKHLRKQPPPVCTGSGAQPTTTRGDLVTPLGICGICGCWVKTVFSFPNARDECTTHPYFDPKLRSKDIEESIAP